MDASFSTQFLAMIPRVNAAVWPLHLISYGMAAAVVVRLFARPRISRFVYVALAVLWMLAAVVFHWMYFRPIARSGQLLAVLFAAQAAMFLLGAFRPRTVFRFDGSLVSWFGLALVAFSLIGYPGAGYLLRGSLMQAAWIGVFPCPVGLLTLGLFLLTERVLPKYLLVIPTFWAAAAVFPISWGAVEDSALVIGGLLASTVILYRERRLCATTTGGRRRGPFVPA